MSWSDRLSLHRQARRRDLVRAVFEMVVPIIFACASIKRLAYDVSNALITSYSSTGNSSTVFVSLRMSVRSNSEKGVIGDSCATGQSRNDRSSDQRGQTQRCQNHHPHGRFLASRLMCRACETAGLLPWRARYCSARAFTTQTEVLPRRDLRLETSRRAAAVGSAIVRSRIRSPHRQAQRRDLIGAALEVGALRGNCIIFACAGRLAHAAA